MKIVVAAATGALHELRRVAIENGTRSASVQVVVTAGIVAEHFFAIAGQKHALAPADQPVVSTLAEVLHEPGVAEALVPRADDG